MGLYDIAWEMEKEHKPTLAHSLNQCFAIRPVSGFAILLMVIMIVWMRLLHLCMLCIQRMLIQPLKNYLPLTLGSFIGAIMLALAFSISAFSPQIMMERRIDVMTAVFTSVNAVKNNVGAMLVWAFCIMFLVALGLPLVQRALL